ncbi:hypothetical protein [Pseudacidovorax sp. NFM-22]|uniref:hypothetical protein n=1 Tax=Pseudacidovorax sp. NFM-22 TaxID=2744469 RepID=UPI001F28BC8B|nr:hypothetical protein [Pseudacidovorax sp. NFM-22]
MNTSSADPNEAHRPGDTQEAARPAQALRAALQHLQGRLQAQEAQLDLHRRELDARAAELAERHTALADRQAEVARLNEELARRDAEIAGLRHAAALAAARQPFARRVLRRLARDLRRLLRHAVPAPAAVAPAAAPAATPAVAPPPPTEQAAPAPVQDYRTRMRAWRASGRLAAVRTVALVAPALWQGTASAVAAVLEALSLHCTVHAAMPADFTDDLYLVLDPRAFTVLPPADRRILWQVPDEQGLAGEAAPLLARLQESLAVFEAVQPRIADLLADGLVQHQIFHVPLPPAATALTAALDDRTPFGLPHLLARALHGCGVLDDATFETATAGTRLDGEAVVLCLPEAPERFAHARESLRHGAVLFPGLRHVDGWKGTALSYRDLARRTLRAGRDRLLVWEDDARLPTDFDTRLPALLAQLDAHPERWDLFSGLLTDLSPQARVLDVQPDGSDLLIRLDSVIGMVFGLYGPRALRALADYRFEGEDVMKNTIDRYLEALGLRCCTLFPPLVGHDDHLASTLWAPNGVRFASNASMNAMIDRSQLRLLSKVADFLDGGSAPPAPQRQ